MNAVKYRSKQCVELLLKYNADPYVLNAHQLNALEIAISQDSGESIALLRDRMRSPNEFGAAMNYIEKL